MLALLIMNGILLFYPLEQAEIHLSSLHFLWFQLHCFFLIMPTNKVAVLHHMSLDHRISMKSVLVVLDLHQSLQKRCQRNQNKWNCNNSDKFFFSCQCHTWVSECFILLNSRKLKLFDRRWCWSDKYLLYDDITLLQTPQLSVWKQRFSLSVNAQSSLLKMTPYWVMNRGCVLSDTANVFPLPRIISGLWLDRDHDKLHEPLSR